MPKVSKKVVANMLAVVDGFLPTLPGGMDDADRREALLLAQALQGFSAKVSHIATRFVVEPNVLRSGTRI